jgi:hypothetical protein
MQNAAILEQAQGAARQASVEKQAPRARRQASVEDNAPPLKASYWRPAPGAWRLLTGAR